MVREIVTSEKNLRDDTREKLAMLSSTGRFSKGHFDSPCDRLDTINELNSTGSILASFDITGDRSDDEMELSMVRSSRAARMKRASDQIHMPLNSESTKRRRSSRDVIFKISEHLIIIFYRFNSYVYLISALTFVYEFCPVMGKFIRSSMPFHRRDRRLHELLSLSFNIVDSSWLYIFN